MNEGMRQKKGISGSTLKLIAIVTMFIDHTGAAILGRFMMEKGFMEISNSYDVNAMIVWMQENGTLYWVYMAMRMIGRVAFPIFCFLLVEGFQKTSNVGKYAMRLGMFALISEIPFDLAFKASWMDFSYQNVFFTLFMGLLTMIAVDYVNKMSLHKVLKVIASGAAIAAGAAIAEFMNTDYGAIGVLCIMALYVFRKKKVWQIVAGCLAFVWEFTAPLAFIPIGFYNGKRGLKLKYVFYAFYPVHLLVLYLICVILGIHGYSVL